jgi:hypothetical protein
MLSRRAWRARALLALVTPMARLAGLALVTLLARLAGLTLVTLLARLAGLTLRTRLSLLAGLTLRTRLSRGPLLRNWACVATAKYCQKNYNRN